MKKQPLRKLSAFIVTAILFSASANAQIVYTDVDPDTTVTQGALGSTAYALDINNDGITDATLTASRTGSNRSVFLGTASGSQALVCCPILQARAINFNAFIGANTSGTNASWGTGQEARLRQIPAGGGGGGPAPIPFGDWSNSADRYLALRFSLDGDWYYGWVRVSVFTFGNGMGFTVRDYAYNSVPGEGILAGSTHCAIPFGLAVNNVDSNTVVLSWQSLSADTINLRYRPTGTDTWSVIDTVTTSSFTFAGLTGCTAYEFQVQSQCDGLLSGYSASFIHTTDGCCSVPGLVAVGAVNATSASVSWGSVTAAISYDAQISADGGASWALITDITANFYDFTGLDSCTSYQVRIRTVCNNGTTDWSTPVNFATVACGACIDLTYCFSNGQNADFEWIARVAVGALDNQSGSNNGYGNFTGLSTELQIGQGHPITLQPGYASFAYPEYFKVFVDLDQNGDFTGPGELAYDAGVLTTGPISGILNIPAGALEGSTRMRVVMAYQDPTATSCGWNEYGETEDYCVYLVDNTDGCISGPGLVAVGAVDAGSANVSWGGVPSADSYDVQITADGGASWALITGITTDFYDFTGLDACTSYQVRVRNICNSLTTDWSTPVTFVTAGCGACIDLTYCFSYGQNADFEWIARVALGALDNQSGSNAGYGDFTGLSTELQIGQGHAITLEPGFADELYAQYFKVFLDLDHNGDFTGPGELAYDAGVTTTEPISGTLNIPAGALEGSTRMRVVMVYDDPESISCGEHEFGETEDYCVNLVNTITGVGESPTAGQLHVFPNPFKSTLTVSMDMHKAGMVICTVRAVTGQALLTRTVATTGGPSTIALDLESLASGIYLLEMQVDGERIVRKVVKE